MVLPYLGAGAEIRHLGAGSWQGDPGLENLGAAMGNAGAGDPPKKS